MISLLPLVDVRTITLQDYLRALQDFRGSFGFKS